MSKTIPEIVAQVYGLSVETMISKSKQRDLNEARQMTMYVMYINGCPFKDIVKAVARDKAIVSKYKLKIKHELAFYKETREKFEQIMELIETQKTEQHVKKSKNQN